LPEGSVGFGRASNRARAASTTGWLPVLTRKYSVMTSCAHSISAVSIGAASPVYWATAAA